MTDRASSAMCRHDVAALAAEGLIWLAMVIDWAWAPHGQSGHDPVMTMSMPDMAVPSGLGMMVVSTIGMMPVTVSVGGLLMAAALWRRRRDRTIPVHICWCLAAMGGGAAISDAFLPWGAMAGMWIGMAMHTVGLMGCCYQAACRGGRSSHERKRSLSGFK